MKNILIKIKKLVAEFNHKYSPGRVWLMFGLLCSPHLYAAQLKAIAILPAASFIDGPVSGQLIESSELAVLPFPRQPLQGFSDLIFHQQQWLAIADNGFGSKKNSADHLLMVYQLDPGWKMANGGSGILDAKLKFTLSDPLHKVTFPVVAEAEFYPGTQIRVDRKIRQQRLLTGADFDIESFRVAADGSYWFGDEFGPFLLHTNRRGELLEAPLELPGLWSPQNPLHDPTSARVQASGGFEGMALSADGKALIVLLEKPLINATRATLNAYRFELASHKYTGLQWQYPLHDGQHRVGALAEAPGGGFVLIERDGGQGIEAKFKKVFSYQPDSGRVTELVDLLKISDPQQLASSNGVFRYPFVTIEALVMPRTDQLIILNDNNYPFSVGRHQRSGAPDDSEMIVLGLGE